MAGFYKEFSLRDTFRRVAASGEKVFYSVVPAYSTIFMPRRKALPRTSFRHFVRL